MVLQIKHQSSCLQIELRTQSGEAGARSSGPLDLSACITVLGCNGERCFLDSTALETEAAGLFALIACWFSAVTLPMFSYY